MSTQDTVSFIEDVLRAVTQSALVLIGDFKRNESGKPFGWESADIWTQLENYLTVRDSPKSWQQLRDERVALYGVAYAEADLLREITRLEGLLDSHGGQDGVTAYWLMKRLGKASRDVEYVNQLLTLPRIEIRPSLPPPADPLMAVMAQAGQTQASSGVLAGQAYGTPLGTPTAPLTTPHPPPFQWVAPKHDIMETTYGGTGEPLVQGTR